MPRLALAALVIVSLLALAAAERPWMNRADPPAVRAQKLLAQMTIDEKIVMLHGPPDTMPCCECEEKSGPLCNYTGNVFPNTRLGIPQIKMNDGPQGFRDGANPGTSTAWPSAMTVGATWDAALVRAWGVAMGKEFWGKGANVQLGPGVNVARVPRNGRNFEYMSGEDPYLGYTLVQPAVQGIQSQGVIADAKHYVLNNQETNRNTVSDDADERTRFEMYYLPFIGAIEAGVGSMMCSYNKIFGTWACENNQTLATDLKVHMGFQGFVMSDWGATHTTSIQQGLDMEMPGAYFMGDALAQLVANGTIATAFVDDAVLRTLTPMFQMGLFDNPNPNLRSTNVTSDAHNDLARRLSAASTVLLKNTNGVLPIDASAHPTVAVLGWADVASCFTHGDGSGTVTPSRIISPLMGITNRLGGSGVAQVNHHANSSDFAGAVAAAREADYAIVFVGASSGEGSDRASLSLLVPGDDLVAAVAKANPKTIVVVATVGMVLMPWAGDVAAILTNFMPGQEVGNAIADVLFAGGVNPSGRLTFTMPNVENEQQMTPAQWPGLPANNPAVSTYTEGLFFGYRWYDQHQVAPLFPFGHGLSYTTFAYSELLIKAGGVGPTDAATLAFALGNTGALAGAEVWQVYVGFPPAAGEPPKVLRGFGKTLLESRQTMIVTATLTQRDLSVWDPNAHAWAPVRGTFAIYVGASSRDIRLTGSFVY